MNILIPLCGLGERFAKEGYDKPKPLVNVMGKPIFHYVLDSLNVSNDDKIFVFYHTDLDTHNFASAISENYSNVLCIPIHKRTLGAAETIYVGLQYCFQHNLIDHHSPCMSYDCDTYYTMDTVALLKSLFRDSSIDGAVFYSENKEPTPVYSYIKLDITNKILAIAEKKKISDNANCGIYCFSSAKKLYDYSHRVASDNEKFMNGECYISCVIKLMIEEGMTFKGIEVPSHSVISLGTPKQVMEYQKRTHAFLFDLDGTLVLTDDIYVNVWRQILAKFNISMDLEMFKKYIQGNNDLYVLRTLLPGIKISLEEISTMKDTLFIESIADIHIVPGVLSFFHHIKQYGHKIGIVTNCNRTVAEKILEDTGLGRLVDCLIISNECTKSKPHPDPYLQAMKKFNIYCDRCIIFEDSKTGLLSGKNSSPKALVAVQNLYTDEVYQSLGVTKHIETFEDLQVSEFLESKTDVIEILRGDIKRSVQNSRCFHKLQITDIQIDSTKLKGGYITDAVRVKIITNFHTYDCVLKLENKKESFLSKMAQDLGLYEREYYFYDAISPFINVKDVGIPTFYCLVRDEKGGILGILLENLYTLGCKLNLNLNDEPVDTTLQVINDCARLHTMFVDKDCEAMFGELKRHNHTLFQPKWERFMAEKWPEFKVKWTGVLDPSHIELMEWVVNNFHDIQNYMSSGQLTLCHGDVKSPNIFYQPVGQGYKPYFIDWQYIAYGKGVQDIVFFLIESFDIGKIRETVYLYRDYYYVKCKEYSEKLRREYTVDEYRRDFLYSIFYFPFFVAIWFGTLSQEDLIDKNFPFFFIQKLCNFVDLFKGEIAEITKSK
jgi:HAD superfamily hydrolase (TIGR01509 family)